MVFLFHSKLYIYLRLFVRLSVVSYTDSLGEIWHSDQDSLAVDEPANKTVHTVVRLKTERLYKIDQKNGSFTSTDICKYGARSPLL